MSLYLIKLSAFYNANVYNNLSILFNESFSDSFWIKGIILLIVTSIILRYLFDAVKRYARLYAKKRFLNAPVPQDKLDMSRHILYFKRHWAILPDAYVSADTNRITLLFFAISALDLLGELEKSTEFAQWRLKTIEWIYSLQISPPADQIERTKGQVEASSWGFRGSTWSGAPFGDPHSKSAHTNDKANLALTYTALCCLVILGDDLERVNKAAIVAGMKYLQRPDGSFAPCYGSLESDMRFLYSACAVSYILGDFAGINIAKAVSYVRNCTTFDMAFAQRANQEAHGGSTFCAVASLSLIATADPTAVKTAYINQEATLEWCLLRQQVQAAFQGRPNKPIDSCYSFWIGASIALLGGAQWIDHKANINWLYTAQTKFGGFSKFPGSYPDILHAYMGVAGLSLSSHPHLRPLNPALNISQRAVDFLLTSSSFKR